VDWPIAVVFVAGGALGGLGGVRVARMLADRALLARRLFAVLVLVVAAYVAWRSLAG
jgi:uncharacterized membrane protein YfcA